MKLLYFIISPRFENPKVSLYQPKKSLVCEKRVLLGMLLLLPSMPAIASVRRSHPSFSATLYSKGMFTLQVGAIELQSQGEAIFGSPGV